jgi:hypothetical protein
MQLVHALLKLVHTSFQTPCLVHAGRVYAAW